MRNLDLGPPLNLGTGSFVRKSSSDKVVPIDLLLAYEIFSLRSFTPFSTGFPAFIALRIFPFQRDRQSS